MSELESVSDRPNHQAASATQRDETPPRRPDSESQPSSQSAETVRGVERNSLDVSNGDGDESSQSAQARKRRRGSRGGRGRSGQGANRPQLTDGNADADDTSPSESGASAEARQPMPVQQRVANTRTSASRRPASNTGARNGSRAQGPNEATVADSAQPDMPDRPIEGRIHNVEVAQKALVPRKPQIGDSMPAPAAVSLDVAPARQSESRPRGSQRSPKQSQGGESTSPAKSTNGAESTEGGQSRNAKRRRGGRSRSESSDAPTAPDGRGPKSPQPAQRRAALNEPVQTVVGSKVELDDETFEKRRGKERNGRPVGRYLMCVQVRDEATQVAVLEGRHLIEHYVSLPQDDVNQIHGNIYLGKVNNVLPGMEAAFVEISTPKNAVLYRGDAQYEAEDVDDKSGGARIEQMLRNKQLIVCQVTKNPIGLKGARLTQEVSLPGRFVVLVPNSRTYGISKRLPDDERKRLRSILDRVKPSEHGLIVRTAAEGANAEELRRDVKRLISQWDQIEDLAERARKSGTPRLLYREPSLAVRVIREELNKDYRGVIIDDAELFQDVKNYVDSVSPELSDRVEYFDRSDESLPLYERFHIVEQLQKAIDRKVWLPSGGSLIIERTEALTVIDVNTGKNVGTSSLEQTVYKNNLEAADEIARQLRLRDIGGIIVIDFIDMEVKSNRDSVIRTFRDALARDKTRTQVFDISELGLVEMTRKRIGEGLLESLSHSCEVCAGRGFTFNPKLINPDD